MDVIFETTKGREFSIEIWFFAKILQIKDKIQKHEGIPIASQTLVFKGKVLADDGDTELYQILQGSRIQLVVESEAEKAVIKAEEPVRVVLSINMATPKKQFSLECEVTDRVGHVKERIQESEGIPASRLAMYVGSSTEMLDQQLLGDYGITESLQVNAAVRPSRPPAPAAGQKKMKVLVLTKCGTKKIPVEVNPCDNVSELRKELQRLSGHMNFHLPQDGYFFIYKQNILEEDRTFKWQNVRSGDTIEIFNGSVTGGS